MAFTIKPMFTESTKYFVLSSSFLNVGDVLEIAQIGYGTTIGREGIVQGIAICTAEALAYTEAVDKFVADNPNATTDEIRVAVKGVKQGKFIWFSSTVFNKYDLEPTNRKLTDDEKENGIMHKGTLCDLLRKFVEEKAENGNFEAKHLDELSTLISGKKVVCGRDFKYKNDRGFNVSFLKYDFK